MNSKIASLMAMSALAMSMNNTEKGKYTQTQQVIKKHPEWQRKKCKSCKLFSCRPYQSPISNACEKYIKRKK